MTAGVHPDLQGVAGGPVIDTVEHSIDLTADLKLVGIEKRPADSPRSGVALLIHGSGCGYPYFDLEAPGYSMMDYLAARGCRAFAFDLPGYGASTKPRGDGVRAEAVARHLGLLIDKIRERTGLERVSLVAHSWGGAVAFELAAAEPQKIDRLVVLGCPYKKLHPAFAPVVQACITLAGQGVDYIENAHHLLVHERTHSYDPEVMDAYKRLVAGRYPVMPSGVFLDLDTWGYSECVPKITAPTLLIAGSLEYVVERADLLDCLDALGAEEKQLLWIGNAYHLIFLEKEAHVQLNAAVASWVC